MALRIVVFASGAVLMALEILAFRIIAKTFGSQLRETTAVVAVFLIAMSCGYYLGGKWGDRWPRWRTLALPMVGAGLAILLVPTLDGWVSERVFNSSLPLGLHAILTCLTLFGLPCLLLATVSPVAVRLSTHTLKDTGSTAGSVAALSALGSIVGTVLMGFYLIDAVGSITRLVYGLGAALLALAGVAVFGPRRNLSAAVMAATLIVVCGSHSGSVRAEVIFERDSSYHHVVVRDEDGARYLYFDSSPESRMDRNNPIEGAYEYTDYFNCALLFNPSIKDVLFLGLGGGSAPKRFLHDYPKADIDVVDIDPLVVEVAQKYFAVTPGPRLRLHVDDARAFVKRSHKSYDLIVIDAYTKTKYGASLPAHLATREFFAEVKRRLHPGGMVAYNVMSDVARPGGSPFTLAMVRTMATQFTSPYLFHAETTQNTIVIAFNERKYAFSREELIRRAQYLVSNGSVKLPDFERRAGRVVAVPDLADAILLTDDNAPVDKLLRSEQ